MATSFKKQTSAVRPSKTFVDFAGKLVNKDQDKAFDVDDLANSGDSTTVAADVLVIPVTYRYVAKTTGTNAEALTLADGTFKGQKVKVDLVAEGGASGDGTLTPATANGWVSVLLADVGDFVDLEWTDDGWIITGIGGASAQPVVTLS